MGLRKRLKHIGWFFQFIWWCIRDLRTPLDCINDIGLFKENWGDFKIRIHFDTDPEMIAITKQIQEL